MLRCFAIIVAVLCVAGCERKHDGKTLLLDWHDAEANITFRVTEAPVGIVKLNTRLHVERDGHDFSVMIDDDARFSTITFVRYENWLLVVCRGADEVWAGYDYKTKRMLGEYRWESFPFTKWSGQGTVVAERKLRETYASPANFPR